MSFHHRIRTIYTKELIDILRDRRTLIAMIVVPIVLYPLLMLGSIQAMSFQAASVEREELHIGVVNETQGLALRRLIDIDKTSLDEQRAMLGPDSEAAEALPTSLSKVYIRAFGSQEVLEQRVRDRSIHAGVIFDSDTLVDAPEAQNRIELLVDREDIRSASAEKRLQELIARITTRTVEQRKRERNLPASFDQPFDVSVIDLSAPPSILGQILPLILILMTITGAIYPAIDLTAGERERGTLESLMVCPVPVIDLIVGKFLVVTTVAIMGAALNLASVTATVYFGGFDKMIARSGGGIPWGTMLFILLTLIPFAVLMSAIMIAVCSYARTFKEAQNYVTPVIMAVLIPGGIAALPATKLEGVMLVMPVGNMVLLARELLLGAVVPLHSLATVLLSTTLYAAAAVAVAASVFGKESVVFADAGSLKHSLSRRAIKPSRLPSVAMSVLVVALLFPAWFFVQSAFSPGPGEDASGLLSATGWLMPLMFVLVPLVVLLYWKVEVRSALALRLPSARHFVAGVLVGLSAWVLAYELNVLQQALIGAPELVIESSKTLVQTLRALPVGSVLVLIAVVPACCEELLFRGFLLSGLRSSGCKWTSIFVSAAIFGVFHFMLFKFLVTAVLGVLLAYLCWQSRSVVPAIVAHLLHNTIGALNAVNPEWFERLGITPEGEWGHLPLHILLSGATLLVLGLIAMKTPVQRDGVSMVPAVAEG